MQTSFFWGFIVYLISLTGCWGTPPYVEEDYDYAEDDYADYEYDSYASEAEFSAEEGYANALASWEKLKKHYNNSYVYTVDYTAADYNSGYSTTIVVHNGKIEERHYESFTYQDDQKVINDRWVELKKKVGKNKEGFLAKTMDELYADCGNNYIKIDKSVAEVIFEVDYNSILSLCGYWSEDCENNCFEGITVLAFSWLETKP